MKKAFILSIAVTIAVSSSGCVKESNAEPIRETVISESLPSEEETETESEADGAWSGITEEGDSISSIGKYGEYGEGMYNVLIDLWKNWTILDEAELRINATAMLGLIAEEDYEAIITEILSLDRGTNPTAQPAQQETQPAQTEQAKPANNNTSSNNTTPTQPATNTAPSPETQAPQVNNNDSEDSVISIEEAERMLEEAGLDGNGKSEVGHIGGWSGPGNFNWQ